MLPQSKTKLTYTSFNLIIDNFLQNKCVGLLILIILLLLHSTKVSSQDSLFTYLEIEPDELSSSQLEKYSLLVDYPHYIGSFLVTIDSFESKQDSGEFYLNLRGYSCNCLMRSKRVHYASKEEFYWYGEVVKDEPENPESQNDYKCYNGILNLLKTNNKFIGSLSIDEEYYELHHLGDDVYSLISLEDSLVSLTCGVPNSMQVDTIIADTSHNSVESGKSDFCPVRVLALYTSAAEDAVPSITATIALSIEQMNQAFINSKLANNFVELSVAAVEELEFEEGTLMQDDINELIGNSNLQSKRSQYEADIVVVFVSGEYIDAIGIAGTLHLESDSAVCMVEVKLATTDYLTSHEIGHLFGCRHAIYQDPYGTFNHGHVVSTGFLGFSKRPTVMVQGINRCQIQYFSNPNQYFKNKATGKTNISENAKWISDYGCNIANFYDYDPNLGVRIISPLYWCPGEPVGLTSEIVGDRLANAPMNGD